MRWITFSILLYVMYAMQIAHVGAIPHVRGDDWPRIEYLVILTVFYSLYAAESAAPFCGLLCGLCYDLGNNHIIGTNTVPLALVAWLVVRIRLSIFREHFVSQMLLALMAILAFGFFSLPMRYVSGAAYDGLSPWTHLAYEAGDAVYSAIAAPLLFWIFFRFQPLLGFSTHGPRVRGHN